MSDKNEELVSIDTVDAEEIDIIDTIAPQLDMQDYHIKKNLDNQEFLTKSWASITGFVIIVPISTVLCGVITVEQLEKIYSLVLTPVMAILGSIAGYYFGKSKIE